MNFRTDQDISADVAPLLTTRGHDVVAIEGLGRKGGKDDAVLLLAARLGRVLVTHNVGDFVMLHRAWHR